MEFNNVPRKIRILGEQKQKLQVEFLEGQARKTVAMTRRFLKKRIDAGLFELEETKLSRKLI
jgi:hypothetical protein